MNHSVQTATTLLDESTLRTWEDMRSQVLHELQEGAQVPDAVVEFMAELAVRLKAWRSGKAPLAAYNAN